jgi:hypothetical protein
MIRKKICTTKNKEKIKTTKCLNQLNDQHTTNFNPNLRMNEEKRWNIYPSIQPNSTPAPEMISSQKSHLYQYKIDFTFH